MNVHSGSGYYLNCSNGGLMSMYDDQEIYMSGLIKFMKSVNKGDKNIRF